MYGKLQKPLVLPSGYLTVCHGKSPFLIGKPYINGPFSMAMSNNWRVPLIFPGKYGGSAHG